MARHTYCYWNRLRDFDGYRGRDPAVAAPAAVLVGPEGGFTAEERAAIMKRERDLRSSMQAPNDAFQKLFADADWSKLDPKEHAEILKSGLMNCSRDDRPEVAVRACKMFLALFPEERAAEGMRNSTLPGALMLNGNLDVAAADHQNIKLLHVWWPTRMKRMRSKEDRYVLLTRAQ